QGMNIYERDDVPAGTLMAVSLSGTAPPPDANAGAEQGPQGRDAQQGGGEGGGVSIQQVPGRLDGLKWYLIGGFVGVFALLAVLLARKPVVAVAGPATEEKEPAPQVQKKTVPSARPVAPAARGSAAPTNGAA